MTGTNMRPASKSPSFLVIGLLVALGILAFNYWNLSSKSKDLKKQVDALHVDLRFESDKHLMVEKRASDLASKLSDSDAKLTQIKNDVSEREKNLQDLTNEVNKLKSELQTATTTLEESKKTAELAVNEKKSVAGEMDKLRAELTEAKKPPTTCSQSQCRDVIRDLISTLTTQVAKGSVGTALKDKQEVMGMIGDLLQGPDQAPKDAAAAQPAQLVPAGQPQGQPQVVEQGPNVIQMQQPQAADEGQANNGGQVGDGYGVGKDRNSNFINALAPLNQQQQHQQQQLQQQQPPRDVLLDLSKQGDSPKDLRSEGNAPQIVPQNIPQPGADDGTANNAVLPNIANDPAAQEDVSDDRHLDLPEDEMDQQARANHGAEDLGNLGNNLHDQLQDLSKNDRAIDQNKEDEDDEEEAKEDDRDIISQDKPALAKEEREEEDDYDIGPNEKRNLQTKRKPSDQRIQGNLNGQKEEQEKQHKL